MKTAYIPIEPETAEKRAEDLLIGGLTRFTTIDFPGYLSAVVFIKGCPWNCLYCQNPELRAREMHEGDEHISWQYLIRFLTSRKGLIDGVVFSGGEPCVDPALPEAVKKVKELGYKIGLHTGGMYPKRLAQILPFLDWVGLDVKAPLEDEEAYEKVVRRKAVAAKVSESLEILLEAKIPLEVRTTAHPEYLTEDQLEQIAHELNQRGVSTFALQIYRQPMEEDESRLLPRVGSDYPSETCLEKMKNLFSNFIYRRN